MASSESGRFSWQPLWFYTKGFSDEAVNASISVLKYSFFPFVVDTNYTSPLEFKDPPSLLLHRLKPSTTTLFLFILDLYLQQPVCSFVSAWLHCFFVRLLHWVAHWGRLHHPVQKCLMLLLNSLPPSPQTGAPPLRRGLSCGRRSELLPVNKINHGRHQRTNSAAEHLAFTAATLQHRLEERFII